MQRAWWLAGALLLVGATAGVATALEEPTELVGKDAPEISTKEWINSDGRTTIADFKGEVILLEQFATW
jgi:hypothetical protein